MQRRAAASFGLWLGWTFFVVYGSLLPFDFHPLTIDVAIEGFRQMPFLHLGVESRADWVANGVLYLPVGVFTVRLITALRGGRGQALAVVLDRKSVV